MKQNQNFSPFIKIYLGATITSFLLIVIGFLAKFKFIVTERYNFENCISGGIIILISATILFGVSFLFVVEQKKIEENN